MWKKFGRCMMWLKEVGILITDCWIEEEHISMNQNGMHLKAKWFGYLERLNSYL